MGKLASVTPFTLGELCEACQAECKVTHWGKLGVIPLILNTGGTLRYPSKNEGLDVFR